MGEINPDKENKSYEALYPTDPAISGNDGPSFHYLEGFQTIDLSEIGYEEQEEYSDTWKVAIPDGDNIFQHEILHPANCKNEIMSDQYRTTIKTQRNNDAETFTVEIVVQEDEEVRPVIPAELTKPGIIQKYNFDISPLISF